MAEPVTALVGVSMTETLLSKKLGTYTNGPCCARTASGASIAMPPSQMLASNERLSFAYEGLPRGRRGIAHPPFSDHRLTQAQLAKAASALQRRPGIMSRFPPRKTIEHHRTMLRDTKSVAHKFGSNWAL